MKPSTSSFVPVRGLQYHVRTWGEPGDRKLFMLHGWMDVSASFQFLIDALKQRWHVIAPDWRGFGRSEWCADGYWFPDYIADLDAIVDHFSADEPARLLGHSLGGNIACLFAGIRPDRVMRAISLDGFGLPEEPPDAAPDKLAKWLEALKSRPAFTVYPDLAAVADRLQKNNARLTRDKAEFLAAHWASVCDDGNARLVSDPKHKLPFATVYRMEEVTAIWRRVTVPVLWVGAEDSFTNQWLGGGEAGARKRMAALRDSRLHMIADAGHMLHHDQPGAVASVIEDFLCE